MKNLKSLRFLTLIISILASSCSTNTTDEIVTKDANSNFFAKSGNKLLWDPALVASKHNDGLEYIFNHIHEAPLNNQNDTNAFLGAKSLEFVLQNGLDSKYADNVPETIIDEDIIAFENQISTTRSSDFSYEYYYLKNLMLDDKKTLIDKITLLSNYTPVKSFNSDLEYTMIITMAKVGKSSLEYWNTKGGSWQTAVGNTEARFNWSIIGFSDAGGAVTAAAGLWATGAGAGMIAAGGPAGAVGVALVIAAGGIGSSATAFVGQAIFGGWF